MFNRFKKYKVKLGDKATQKKHLLYAVKDEDIEFIENYTPLPIELRVFYREIGYGFFHTGLGAFYRLLSPMQLKQINCREDFYKYDIELDSYEERYNGEKYLFFEVNEGIYLAIDKKDYNGKNSIYLFDKKIANSLEDFLSSFDENPNYFD